MQFFSLILGSSFLLCLLCIPVIRVLGLRFGLVDKPDGHRKIHGRAVPVIGGLAIFVSFAVVLGAALSLEHSWRAYLDTKASGLIGLCLAGVIICAVGVADDYGCLRGRHKLLGQLLATLVVIQYGTIVRTIHFFDSSVELGLLAMPFTILWLLAAINSLNLLDGMDGLLGSVGLIIVLAIAAMAFFQERWEVAVVAMALAGGLMAFLLFNLPPASIFLGDAGSMLIGLVIGTLAIRGSLKSPAAVALATPTALLTIPFFDTVAAIIRRKLTGRSIYTTDRGHLHHCLLRRGLSSRGVLLWVSCFCLMTVAGALASLAFKQEIIALLAAVAVVSIMIVTQMFGYVEFVLVRKRLTSLALSFLRGRKNEPHLTEVRLQGSMDWAELWCDLLTRTRGLNLHLVRLNINAPSLHEGYHARWESPHADLEDGRLWHAQVPLTAQGQSIGRLDIAGQRDDEPVWKKVERIMDWAVDFEAAAAVLLSRPKVPSAESNGDGHVTSPAPWGAADHILAMKPEDFVAPASLAPTTDMEGAR